MNLQVFQKPDIESRLAIDEVFNFATRLITQALQNEFWNLELCCGNSKYLNFYTGTVGQKPIISYAKIELTYDSKGIIFHSKSSIHSVSYSDLNFNFVMEVYELTKWFHNHVATADELKIINGFKLKQEVQKFLNDFGYEEFTISTLDDPYLFDIYMSGSTAPVEFRVEDFENSFTLTSINPSSNYISYTLNYFDLLEGNKEQIQMFCDWLVGAVHEKVNYQHKGFEVVGFYQDQQSWFMSYHFLNELGNHKHTIQAKRKDSDLLKNLLSIFVQYSKYNFDYMARHDETKLPMLSYNEVLGLSGESNKDTCLFFDYSAPNPLIYPDEVLKMALLEFIKPITDLIVQRI